MRFSFRALMSEGTGLIRRSLLVMVGCAGFSLNAQTPQEIDAAAKALLEQILGPTPVENSAKSTPTPSPMGTISPQPRLSERDQILQVGRAFQQQIRTGKVQDAYLKAAPEFRSKYNLTAWNKVVGEIENRMGRTIAEPMPVFLELEARPGTGVGSVLNPVWKCRFPVRFENGDGEDLVLVTKVASGQFAVVDYAFEARPFRPTVGR